MSGTCPRCGHTVRNTATFCGFCGQELAASRLPAPSNTRTLLLQKGAQSGENPHQGWTLTLTVLAVAVLVFGGIIALGAVEVQYGRRDRARAEASMAETYYQQGLVYLQQQEYTLAAIEFELATELNPQHEQAAAGLAEVRRKLGTLEPATPDAVTTPTETATIQPESAVPPTLRDAYARGDWEAVLSLAEQLPAEVSQDSEMQQISFDAYYQSGLRLVEENKMVEAVRRFDQALTLQAGNAAVAQARDWAALYLTAMDFWDNAWPQAIENLAALYAQSPDYKDVRMRLHDAYVTYGDQLAGQEDFCGAAGQYDLAQAVVPDAEVTGKRDDAQIRCDQALAPLPAEAPAVPPGTFVGRVVEQTDARAKVVYIHGKVLDKEGVGISGAQVQIQAWDWKATATTDGAGQYSFDGLRNPVTFTVTLLNYPSVPVDAPTDWAKITWVNFEETR